jgi:hypothetical protein
MSVLARLGSAAGTIAFRQAGGIDCPVRNLSDSGACLEIEDEVVAGAPLGSFAEFALPDSSTGFLGDFPRNSSPDACKFSVGHYGGPVA